MSLPSYTTVKELKVKKRRYRISLKKRPGTYLKLQLKAGGGGGGGGGHLLQGGCLIEGGAH